MAVRFRIRTPEGQELSFATRETFEDFVRSGDLSPDDLVYDAEDGSWSSARAHPLVLEIEYAKEEEAERAAAGAGQAEPPGSGDDEPAKAEAGGDLGLSLAPERPRPEDGDAPAEPEPDAGQDEPDELPELDGAELDGAELEGAGDDLGLELAPVEEVTEEEATRQFIQRMEAEREASLDFGSGQKVGGFAMDDSGTLADMLAPAPEPPPRPAPETRAPDPPSPRRSPPPSRAHGSRPEPDERGRGRSSSPEPAESGGGGGWLRFFAILVVAGLVGGGGYFGYRTALVPAEEPVEPPPAEALPVEPEPEPAPEPVIAQTEAAVRERARERYLTATQNALRDLPEVPPVWATGPYFATPSDHGELVTLWQTYLATIRRVRQADAGRYATAYDAALDDAAITGDARATRRERALADFAGTAIDRAAHFDRVEALASAAIQSHQALVESEGLILYSQGSAPGGRTGMGAGASGRDAEAELLLAQVVELLEGTLDADGLGPGDAANVRAWVWDGFLDAATR